MIQFTDGYEAQLVTSDIITADTTMGLAGVPMRIGIYTVPAGQAIYPGLGSSVGQDSANGRIYVDIQDDTVPAAAEDGQLILEARSPGDRKIIKIWEGNTRKARSGDADTRAAQIPFPKRDFFIPENWTIQLWFVPEAAGDVVAFASCVFLMDCMKGVTAYA